MRKYFCDVCGIGFLREEIYKLNKISGMAQQLPESDKMWIVQHLEHELSIFFATKEICFDCQCKISGAATKMALAIQEGKQENKDV